MNKAPAHRTAKPGQFGGMEAGQVRWDVGGGAGSLRQSISRVGLARQVAAGQSMAVVGTERCDGELITGRDTFGAGSGEIKGTMSCLGVTTGGAGGNDLVCCVVQRWAGRVDGEFANEEDMQRVCALHAAAQVGTDWRYCGFRISLSVRGSGVRGRAGATGGGRRSWRIGGPPRPRPPERE